jgi:lipopolysaccharide transport system permease protein
MPKSLSHELPDRSAPAVIAVDAEDRGADGARIAEVSHDLPEMIIAPMGRWPGLNARELWDYRGLFYFMVWRDLKIRYQQTVLGVSWALIQPLISTFLFTIIFGRLAKVPSDGVPYPVFALVAMVPWTFFATAYSNSSMSLVGNANMISKIYFPRLIIALTPTLVGLVDMAVAAVLLLAAMIFFGVAPSPIAIVLVPFLLLLLTLTTAGVGSLFAAVNLEYRDVKHVLPFLTQLWMYASPVVYPLSLIPPKWRLLYAVNPLAGIIEGLRASLLGRGTIPWGVIGVSTVSGLLLFTLGTMYFRRVEPRFADLV